MERPPRPFRLKDEGERLWILDRFYMRLAKSYVSSPDKDLVGGLKGIQIFELSNEGIVFGITFLSSTLFFGQRYVMWGKFPQFQSLAPMTSEELECFIQHADPEYWGLRQVQGAL